MSSSNNTQLIKAADFKAENMVFAKPKVLDVPNAKGVKYVLIPIAYKNADGTIGDMCLLTEKVFTFGISEPFNSDSAYTLALSLHNRISPTENEKRFTDNIQSMLKHARQHIQSISTSSEFTKNKLSITKDKMGDFETTPLKWAKDKATGESTMANPIMNVKLMTKFRDGEKKITSLIVDPKGKPISHTDLIKKYGNAQCVLKIDGLFIGKSVVSCQIRLLEAVIETNETRAKPLFAPMWTADSAEDTNGAAGDDDDDDSVSEDIELTDDDDDDDE